MYTRGSHTIKVKAYFVDIYQDFVQSLLVATDVEIAGPETGEPGKNKCWKMQTIKRGTKMHNVELVQE